MMKKVSSIFWTAILVLATMVVPGTTVAANTGSTIIVETATELKNAVESASEETTITLGDTFPTNITASVALNINHNNNITIDGENKELVITGAMNEYMNITNNGSAAITVKNLKMTGTATLDADGYPTLVSPYATGIKVASTQTEVTLDNMVFNKFSGYGAVVPTYNSKLLIIGTTFSNNISGGSGAAINAESGPNQLIIRNSTFTRNLAVGSGYDGGAIFLKNLPGIFTVKSSYFEENESLTPGVVAGGRGGAISINYAQATSTTTIQNSYFKNNKAIFKTGTSDKSDGGAIALFDLNTGGTFTINNSTFEGNVADDDGGALLLQAKQSANITINDSTFYNNIANGKGNSEKRSGGAIQVFANGNTFTSTNVMFKNNSFVENKSYTPFANQTQEGGAVAGSGAALRTAKATWENNLVLENHVYAVGDVESTTSLYRNAAISNVDINANKANVGFDNGVATTVIPTKDQVFGAYGISYGANGSTSVAGNPNGATPYTIPTILIAPGNGITTGLADNFGAITTETKDERNFVRSTSTPDAGAVEIAQVKYDSNGGLWSLPAITQYTGSVYYDSINPEWNTTLGQLGTKTTAIQTTNLTHTTSIFVEWNTKADGSGTSYLPGAEVTYGETTTLYAQWAENTKHTVTYDGNTSTSGTAPVDASSPYYVNSSVTVLSEGSLVKANHTFTGWNTVADGSGTAYAASATFAITGNTTLYAQWLEAGKHTVTYNGNTNTGGNAPIDVKSPYYVNSMATVLPNVDLVKTNHTFTGWNTVADGSGTAYAANATFTVTGNTTLYAQWLEAGKHTVTYNGNTNTGGNAPIDVKSPYYVNSMATVLPNVDLVKTNHIFTGWNTVADGSGISYTANSTFTITGDTTLYAQWQENIKYTVTYEGNTNTSGTAPVDVNSYYAGTDVEALSEGTLVKANHRFIGWNTKADGTGIGYTVRGILRMPSANVTVYAQWKSDAKYSVTYDGNGFTSGTSPVDSLDYYAGDIATALDQGTLVKTGYTFIGWNTLADGTGSSYGSGSSIVMPNADVIVYAQWQENGTYRITYDGNTNTSGATPSDTQNYYEGDSATILSEGTLLKLNHTFTGWNTSADGSGTTYALGETLLMPATNVILYAQWQEDIKYTVTYEGNTHTSGAAPIDANSYYAGTEVEALGAGTLKKEHYTFSGWNTKADGSGVGYTVKGILRMPSANVTVYAQWVSDETYTITYEGNTHTSGVAPIDNTTYFTGENAIILDAGTLVKDTYTFIGWNTAEDGSGVEYVVGSAYTMPNANVTVYAQWQKNEETTEVVPPTETQPQPEEKLPVTGENIGQQAMVGALVLTLSSIALLKRKRNSRV